MLPVVWISLKKCFEKNALNLPKNYYKTLFQKFIIIKQGILVLKKVY
jgi:hypothetical protein